MNKQELAYSSSLRVALILAGGGGTRLWPASTPMRPKQVIPGLPKPGQNLLSTTLHRLTGLVKREHTYFITTQEQSTLLQRALPQFPSTNFILEPEGRNTAACVALGLLQLQDLYPHSELTVLILPADHHIQQENTFAVSLQQACLYAEEKRCIVTLGITPTHADTGYGYLQYVNDPLSSPQDSPLYPVSRFVEKPDPLQAQRYVDSQEYLWNAGIFVSTFDRLQREYQKHCPSTWKSLSRARQQDSPDSLRESYRALASESIDTAIMEKQSDLHVLPIDVGWSDLGSWQAIAALLPKDLQGNAIHASGEAPIVHDSKDCLLWSEQGPVVLLGLEGLAVIQVEGRTLVCPRDRLTEARALLRLR